MDFFLLFDSFSELLSLFARLLAVLLFLLLQLPEVALDGCSGFLYLNRAEWRLSGGTACPVAGIGV